MKKHKYPRYFIYISGDTGPVSSNFLFVKILEPGGLQVDVFLEKNRVDRYSRKENAMLRWVKQRKWKEILVEEVALKFGRI